MCFQKLEDMKICTEISKNLCILVVKVYYLPVPVAGQSKAPIVVDLSSSGIVRSKSVRGIRVCEADHEPPSSAKVNESVELYIHLHNTPPWRGAQLKKKA
jgi:hypothetical protein